VRDAVVTSGWFPPVSCSRAGAREEGKDFADGDLLAGGFGQREVYLDLVPAAAAVVLLDDVPAAARSVTIP